MNQKVRFQGLIENWLWSWSVRSFSDFRVRYEVTIDFCTGEATCECMHFQCRLRKTFPTVLTACKHVKEVWKEAKRILERRRFNVSE